MSLFFEWNSLLLQNYFSPAQAGRDVWIPTTNLELESIGVHLGGSAGLIEAVKQGPTWLANNESIVNKATDLVMIRNMHANSRPSGYCDPGRELEIYKGVNAPTYLPYLALWVLAQSETGRGFYQKVSDLIGMEFNNEPLVTDAMVMVWKDLEFWSNNFLDDKSKSGTINTTIGIFGFRNPAKKMGLKNQQEDVGQTLGSYGVGSGCYFVLPILGPTTVRDSFGMIADSFLDPFAHVTIRENDIANISGNQIDYFSVKGVTAIDFRGDNMTNLDSLEKNSLDMYAAFKSLYLQNREKKINNTFSLEDADDWGEFNK